MTIFRNASAAGLAALMAMAVPAFAQAPAAPAAAARPAPPPVTHGPPIAGMCVVDVDRVLVESAVGKAANTRLQALTSAVQAELTAEQTALVNDARTFETQRATLAQDAADRRDADLQVRRNALQRKAELRQAEIQATQQKALERIATELDPVQAAVYQQRGCSVLLTRQALLAVNPAMDISAVVITALNARISTLTFERERLDQGAAAPQAAR
jgi:Skp family chaperone for outer membrane proteins